jgi:SAM-dependent methyltransferase
LVSRGFAQRVTGLDLSVDAIAQASAAAEKEGLADKITYAAADLNSYDFKAGYFDAIFGISAVHHIFHLEDFFQNCRKALKPGGLIFLNEYIGPSRWQVPDDALEAMNAVLGILPDRYQLLLQIEPVAPRKRHYRVPIEWFAQNDPSESVRSAEIVSTLKLYFDIIDFRPYGGAISHLLFSGIAANFDESNEDHVTIMKLILLLEDLLEKHKVISTDFATIVAKPKTYGAVDALVLDHLDVGATAGLLDPEEYGALQNTASRRACCRCGSPIL